MPSDAEIEAALSAADFCTNPNTRKLMRRALEAAEAVREREADEVRKWQICEFEGGEEGCPWDDLNNEPDLDPDYLREIRDENKRLQKDDDAFLSTLGGTNGQ